jgi:hypothetical protein
LCNGFSQLVVIEKAITTRIENPLHNGWHYCHCHVPTKCNVVLQ